MLALAYIHTQRAYINSQRAFPPGPNSTPRCTAAHLVEQLLASCTPATPPATVVVGVGWA